MKRKLYSTFAITAGVLCALLFLNASENTVVHSEKFLKLKPHSHDRAPANFNKLRAPIHVSVNRIDDSSSTELISLQGTVKALRDFQGLKIEWGVPSDVQVVSGAIETHVSLAAGESKTFEILIAPKTVHNRQIYFNAVTTDLDEGDNYGSSAQYNTTKQEVIAKHLKENFLKARAKVKSGELRKIIF